MFSFGIGIGTEAETGRVEALFQPTVVLHNPYNVPLHTAHLYAQLFWSLPEGLERAKGRTRRTEFRMRSGIAIAHFNYGYSWANPDGVGGASHRGLKFNLPSGTLGNSPGNSNDGYHDALARERAGEPSGWPKVRVRLSSGKSALPSRISSHRPR